MKAKPLITASAIFFFLWATMAVTLASHGLIRSRSIIFLLSVISLAGSVQLLRAIRRESPRCHWGIMEFAGPIYGLFLMPLVGLLLIVAGAACR